MAPLLLALIADANPTQVVASVDGQNAGVRVVERQGEVHVEFMVRDGDKGFVVAALSSGHPAAHTAGPSLSFTAAKEAGQSVVLTGKQYSATIEVPATGGVFSVAVKAKAPKASLERAMFGVVLAPSERPARATWSYVPARSGLIAQERFATPLALVAGGGYGLALMPSVKDLETNRPMNPVLQFADDGRTSPGAILSYGFLPYDRDENWGPRQAARTLDNPESFSWKFDLAVAPADRIATEANAHLWERDGAQRFQSPIPQIVPFRYYTKPTYDLGDDQWWVEPGDDPQRRAPTSADGQAKLTVDENLVRFAWGMRWWGDELQQYTWSKNPDQVMNLVLSAPHQAGMTPIAFDTATASWRMEPFDVGATAMTSRYMLKYAESFSYGGKAQLLARVAQNALDLARTDPNGLSALFLHEFANSPATSGSLTTRQAAEQYLQEKRATLKSLGELYVRQASKPSPETVSLALYFARTGESDLAKRMVERIFLYQALWRPQTVWGTEIFGAFAGEHYSEESQSVYSSDLFETVMLLGMRDYAERAVAALRAPLALFNHATHGPSGMNFPAHVGHFTSAPWFGLNGQSAFGDWRGIAEGVGQTLASLAQVTEDYGSYYTHKDGWTVGIDGIVVANGRAYNAFSSNPLAFEGVFPYEHVDASIDERTAHTDPPHRPAMRSMRLELQDGRLSVVALPGFTVLDAPSRLKGTFVLGDGRQLAAEFLPTGLGASVTREDLAAGPLSFHGSLDQTPLSLNPAYLLAGPPSPTLPWPQGWRRGKGLSDIIVTSLSHDGEPVVSTADNGRGGRDQSLMGVIESQPFLLTENGLKFTLLGKADASLYVELIDPRMGIAVASVQKQTNDPEEYTWELFEHVGQNMVLRITDQSPSGSIEMKGIRSVRIGPS